MRLAPQLPALEQLERVTQAVLRDRVPLDRLLQLLAVVREVVDVRRRELAVPVRGRERVDGEEGAQALGSGADGEVGVGRARLGGHRLVGGRLEQLGEDLGGGRGRVAARLAAGEGFH